MQIVKKADIGHIRNYLDEIFGRCMHKKRQHSLADAAFGLLHSNSLRIHELGESLAKAKGRVKKHTTKQIDRLLSNEKLSLWDATASWVPYVIGERKVIQVAMDWSSFAGDNQETLSLNLVTNHGRATPLLWKTVEQSRLKHNKARYEDQLLSLFKEVLPEGLSVTLMADRGFDRQRFLDFLEKNLNFIYVIRIQSTTTITSENTRKKAIQWLGKNGRACNIKDATLTLEQFPIAQAVIVKDQKMKQAWCLVTNSRELKTREIINLYAKRWSIEPYFRDVKDQRFGLGLSQTHISCPQRRDRLLLIVALSYVLLTLLGAAGESIGFDKFLKVNTVKTRTHSLIRQGIFYYDFFNSFKPQQQEELLQAFNALLAQQPFWTDVIFAI